LKRREKVREIHLLNKEGYTNGQIAKMKGISAKTVGRLLRADPECMSVDGTQIHEKRKLLDPYKEQIYELLEQGFRSFQIMRKLSSIYPGINIKRSTLNDFCLKARDKLFDYTQTAMENPPTFSNHPILAPHFDKINDMLADGKNITVIFAGIKADGYYGSYSLLQQYCRKIKPAAYRTKKEVCTRTVKRKDLSAAIWSGNTGLTDDDTAYIRASYPVFGEIKIIISEFRAAYSGKDITAVKSWCDRYSRCKFPAVCSFINGINADSSAFYNSMKYEYNNGLLEGCVNKLKAVKRSMFGRASYALLKAKLLLTNGI